MRLSRLATVLPFLWVSLVAARAPVMPLPDALLPNQDVALRTAFVAKPGDVVLRARIVRTEKTYLDAAAKVAIDRFSDEMNVGDVLTTVLANDRTKKVVGSSAAVYYCGDDIKARSSFMAVFMGDLGSKFENIVRFCFIDEDKDGKFEHYFLAGAKDPTLLAMRAIDPVAFHKDELVQENEADEIRLRYRKFETRTTEMHFQLEITRNGKPFTFEYIMTPRHMAVRDQFYYRLVTDPQKIPYPMHFPDILGADIGVRSVTPDGEATIVVNRNFEPTLLKPYLPQVNYIFIYI